MLRVSLMPIISWYLLSVLKWHLVCCRRVFGRWCSCVTSSLIMLSKEQAIIRHWRKCLKKQIKISLQLMNQEVSHVRWRRALLHPRGVCSYVVSLGQTLGQNFSSFCPLWTGVLVMPSRCRANRRCSWRPLRSGSFPTFCKCKKTIGRLHEPTW